MKIARIFGVCLLFLLHQWVEADERILSFHSDIRVYEDGSMQVHETITVRSEQNRIRRGIYRDFPTTYSDRFGNRYRVDFTVNSVERDGSPENFFSQNIANGIRTYFGREDYILPSGEYTYTFYYQTNRQLGFYESFDELYWNVTGNDWEFPIDRVSASVSLPDAIPDSRINATAYTGVMGSQEQAFSENRFSGGDVYFQTTRPLAVREGLTIVVNWPKGYITEPDFKEKLQYFYRDNRHIIIGSAGLVILLFYYLLAWSAVGKDPPANVVFTRYEPPPGYSPASIRFIRDMGYDKLCFTAALINLAVKGYLTINENGGEYTLIRTGKDVDMAPGESALVNKLFSGSMTMSLKQGNHSYISNALDAHESSLRADYEKKYFITNIGYFIFGLIITIVMVIAVLFSLPAFEDSFGSIFILAWLTGWSFGVFVLIRSAIMAWYRVKGIVTMIAAIYVSLFACVFAGIEIFVITQFAQILSWTMILLTLAGAGINWIFYELLRAPTLAGRRLLDKIDGFKRYIEVAEKQHLEQKHRLGRTPELFEAYLPYALAMGIEQKWADKFADVLVKVSAGGNSGYRPVWYSGASWDHNHIGDFSSTLSSGFTRAISSSATAPGSGSGSGGGGFSGGGGGGGGGGGW